MKPMRDDTEQKAFCLLGTGRGGTQPGLGGELVPRRGWSLCRETQLLGWGNPGWKTIFAAAI